MVLSLPKVVSTAVSPRSMTPLSAKESCLRPSVVCGEVLQQSVRTLRHPGGNRFHVVVLREIPAV